MATAVYSMEPRTTVALPPSTLGPKALDSVLRVIPPRSAVHVGAGDGVAASRLWASTPVEHLLLVDASADAPGQLSAAATKVVGWSAACSFLGEHDGDDAIT